MWGSGRLAVLLPHSHATEQCDRWPIRPLQAPCDVGIGMACPQLGPCWLQQGHAPSPPAPAAPAPPAHVHSAQHVIPPLDAAHTTTPARPHLHHPQV